jgi:hypothetical protein
LLSKEKIKREWTKVRQADKIGGNFKISAKVHFHSPNFHLINFQSLKVSNILFFVQNSFFFQFLIQEKRENVQIPVKEKGRRD